MITRRLLICIGMACLLISTSGPVYAQDGFTQSVETASMDARIAKLECQLAQLHGQVCHQQNCKKSSCDGSCKKYGFEAGFSLFIARPHMKESFQATITDVGGTLNMIPFDFDNDVTPRVWFGYFDEDGTGIRARYWEYDHSANPLSAAASFTTSMRSTSPKKSILTPSRPAEAMEDAPRLATRTL